MNAKLLLSLTLLFLAGCTLPLAPNSKTNILIQETHKGVDGVEVSFIENTPPAEVFESQWFDIGFNIENKGAVDAQNGIYVIGIPNDLETRNDVYGRFSLKGKSLFNPFGDSKFLGIKARGRELSRMVERLRTMVSIDVCYPYKTEFSAFVCINPEPASPLKTTRVCTPTAQSFSGQGAPLVVASVDAPQILPHDNPALIKPQITAHIKNAGQGIVISKQNFGDACTPKSSPAVYNLVSVGGSISDVPLTCFPNLLRLSEGENMVVCTAEDGLEKSRGIHSAILNINLDYGYLSKKTKQIIIKQALK